MPKTARDVLSNTILRVDAAEPLADKVDEIRLRRASHVAVFAHGQCLGISDFSNAISSADDNTFGDLVKGLRSVNISVDESVEQLYHAFAEPRVKALAVEDERGEFAGVVTRQSLLEALIRDRSPKDELPKEQKRAESLLAGEKRILEIISKSSSENGGLTELVEFVEAQSDGVACSLLLMDENGSRLRMSAPGSLPDSMVHAIDGMGVGPESCLCGMAAFSGQTVSVADIAAETHCKFVCATALEHNIRACCSSPIYSPSGGVLGTIAIYFKEPQIPDEFHQALMDRAVYLAAIAIERKHAEDAIRASESRNRALLEGSPVCTKIIDLESRLQYMSAAGKCQLKISDIEPYYGTTFPPELYPKAWRSRVAQHLERAKVGEISSLECPVLDMDGNEVWYDTTFVPACDEYGHVQYIIVTSVNVTERRKAEQAARQHREELAHVSRISTMGELATGIAHELNQPLSAIASYSYVVKSMVEKLPESPSDIEGVLEKLEEQAVRAGDIVRRLREHVAKTETSLVQADLNTLVRDVASLVDPDVRMAETSLKLILDKLAPIVVVDKIRIQQVLVNLIRNAVDAMEETPVGQREITIVTRIRGDGQAEVIVRDAGKGLAGDELERVFTSFFSTKQEGMGMGLPISRSIIEAYGGKLWSKSNIDRGATFGFTIPLDNLGGPEHQSTVFIVDDDSAIRDSLKMAVEAAGFTAMCYSSAVEFLDAVKPNEVSNSVCLVDMQMPNIDGMELLRQLNEWNIELSVVLITGHGTAAIRQRAIELGAIALLEKPFRMAELQETIAGTLNRTVG